MISRPPPDITPVEDLGPYEIRLQNIGCKNRRFDRIVVQRMKHSPTANDIVENLGSYDPMPNEKNEVIVALNLKRLRYWIGTEGVVINPWVQKLLGKGKIQCCTRVLIFCLGRSGFLPVDPADYVAAYRARKVAENRLRYPEKSDEEPNAEEEGEQPSATPTPTATWSVHFLLFLFLLPWKTKHRSFARTQISTPCYCISDRHRSNASRQLRRWFERRRRVPDIIGCCHDSSSASSRTLSHHSHANQRWDRRWRRRRRANGDSLGRLIRSPSESSETPREFVSDDEEHNGGISRKRTRRHRPRREQGLCQRGSSAAETDQAETWWTGEDLPSRHRTGPKRSITSIHLSVRF